MIITNKLEYYIAFKFLKHNFSNIKYPIFMITIATTLVIIILSIIEGLNYELLSKIIGLKSHIEITTEDGLGFSDYEDFIKKLKSEYNEIIGITPRLTTDAIISTNDLSTGVRIIGTSFTSEIYISNFFNKSYNDFVKNSSLLNNYIKNINNNQTKVNGIILGNELYKKLNIKNDTLVKLTFINTEAYFLPISTFEIGIYDYDVSYCFCELETLQKILKSEKIATSILIKLNDISKVENFINYLKYKLNDTSIIIRSYKEINKSLFNVIQIEQTIFFVIVLLVILLANVSIIIVINQNIYKRYKTITIMNVYGMSQSQIIKIFFIEGIIIGIIGLTLGILFGICGSYLINYLKINVPYEIKLYYSINTIPSKLNFYKISIICLTEFIILIISVIYSISKLKTVNILETLRNL